MSEKQLTWRNTSADFIEIGRAMAEIELCCRNIQATGAVDNKRASGEVFAALRIARKLVRALESLEYAVRTQGND